MVNIAKKLQHVAGESFIHIVVTEEAQTGEHNHNKLSEISTECIKFKMYLNLVNSSKLKQQSTNESVAQNSRNSKSENYYKIIGLKSYSSYSK